MILTILLIIVLSYGIFKLMPKKAQTETEKRLAKRNLIHMITEISIFTAIGLVLDYVSSMIGIAPWANGGSISIAMVPIFMMSYRHGIKGGLLIGLLMGVIQMMWSKYLTHPIVPICDYILPYTVLGLAGLFNRFTNSDKLWVRIIFIPISIISVSILRLGFHTLSGMVAWSTPFVASLTYNFSYLAFNVILCSVLCVILSCSLKRYFTNKFIK